MRIAPWLGPCAPGDGHQAVRPPAAIANAINLLAPNPIIQAARAHLDPDGAVEFITGDNPVLINFSQPWPIELMTLALSPLDLLLMVKSGAEDFTRELYLHMTLLHNLELLRQSEYIFSRGPLQDDEGLRSRHAAGLTLPVRPWDKFPGPRK